MPDQNPANIRMPSSAIALFAVAFVCVMLLGPSTAWAHNVNVFAYVDGDTVATESYFYDGRKCRDSTIEVFDGRGKKLLEGTTDTEGRFSFRAPVRGDLLIRLTASMGHRAEYTVPAAELPEALPAAPGTVADTSKRRSAPARPAVEPGSESESLPTQRDVAAADIEQAVEKAIARQLAPIRRTLEESRRTRRFSDIVGGIGYIVGLMGLILYFRSRQRRG